MDTQQISTKDIVIDSETTSITAGLQHLCAAVRARHEYEVQGVIAQLRNCFRRDADALQLLARVLNENDRYADGLDIARQGLSIDSDNHFLHYHAARALWMCGLTTECYPYAMAAARLWPDIAGTSVEYFVSCVQLAVGDFYNGWRRHRSFYSYPSLSDQLVRPQFPTWGGEPLAGCRFLYVLHQGFGDQIQFLRFAHWLHTQGAIVDVLIDPSLAGIAASVAGVRAVHSYPSVPTGPYEFWSYMMELPEHMNLNVSMLPVAMPYITAARENRDRWKTYIDAQAPVGNGAKVKRVGVVWRGSPNTANDRFRSIDLEVLKPLFSLPSIVWFSVQKGTVETKPESPLVNGGLHNLGSLIEDFADTLAILETLDLVVTVDSSVAHLAGAAGLPVYVLQAAYSEWRWLEGEARSPWYPSMRLFRQRTLGDWTPVVEEVRRALQVWCDADELCLSAI